MNNYGANLLRDMRVDLKAWIAKYGPPVDGAITLHAESDGGMYLPLHAESDGGMYLPLEMCPICEGQHPWQPNADCVL